MEEPRTLRDLSDSELIALTGDARDGGSYEAARGLLEREYARRGLAIQAMGVVDMPVADIEVEEKPLVHNHSPSEGRGLDCGERVVEGNLRGWCMDETPGTSLEEWIDNPPRYNGWADL